MPLTRKAGWPSALTRPRGNFADLDALPVQTASKVSGTQVQAIARVKMPPDEAIFRKLDVLMKKMNSSRHINWVQRYSFRLAITTKKSPATGSMRASLARARQQFEILRRTAHQLAVDRLGTIKTQRRACRGQRMNLCVHRQAHAGPGNDREPTLHPSKRENARSGRPPPATFARSSRWPEASRPAHASRPHRCARSLTAHPPLKPRASSLLKLPLKL